MTRFYGNLHQVRSKSKKLEIQISFGSNKTKGSKQNSQNRLWQDILKVCIIDGATSPFLIVSSCSDFQLCKLALSYKKWLE